MVKSAPNCLLCKIASGVIKADIFYRDDHILAIKDINPLTPGHLVVFSKNHYPLSQNMPPGERAYLFNKVITIAQKLKKETKTDSYNLLVFDGPHSEGLIPHRPHFHVVPRKQSDGLTIDPRSSS